MRSRRRAGTRRTRRAIARSGASAIAAAIALATATAIAAPATGRADPPRGLQQVDELLSRLGETGLRLDAAAAARREGGVVDPTSLRPSGRTLVRLAEAWVASDASAEARLDRLRRLERLADVASPEEAEELRFALATGRYLAAAGGADRWRSGTDAPRPPEILAAEFSTAAESLLRLAARAERERASLSAVLLRASGVESDLLADAQRRLEARSVRASFLAGWSILQRALLRGDASAAAEAAEILVPLLDAGVSDPRPRDVSVDRRGDLGFAQTVLGIAVARGIVRGGDEGERWLELLELDSVDPGLRRSIPVWTLLMRTAAGEPEAARRLLEGWRRLGDDEIDPGWFAIGLLEGLRRGESAASPERRQAWESLARSAAAGLVDHRRDRRLLQLADGAGTAGPWRPAGPLGEVLEALRRAASARGADASRALLEASEAWSGDGVGLRLDAVAGLLDAGAILEAWRAIEATEDRVAIVDPADRERLDWLRLVAIDRLRATDRLAEAGLEETAWARAATAYLDAHPDGPRAGLVAVRLGGESLALDRLVDLASAGDAAIRRSVRSTIARRLAGAAPESRAEILAAWRRLGPIALERDGRATQDREARREAYEAIAVLVAGDGEDLRRAAGLLAAIETGAATSEADERALARGLAAEVALATGDPATAIERREEGLRAEAERGAAAAESPAVAPAAAWMQRVAAGWERSREAAARSRSLAEAWADLAVGAAAEVLAEDAEIASAAVLVRAAALATAGEAERYALGGVRTPEAAEAWRREAARFSLLAEAEEAAAWRGAAIEAVAASAAAARRWDEVLEASRRLLAGRTRGGEAWRTAKALQIEALAELDPEQARAVLDQHRVLDPEWDRGLVGARLRRLDERLPEAVP